MNADHQIPYDRDDSPARRGLHAFVVDGYTEEGFVIQNSRGRDWGGSMGLPGQRIVGTPGSSG